MSPSFQYGRTSSLAQLRGDGIRRRCGLIWTAHFANGEAMTVARILELDRRTTQSGKANTGRWQLEFERQQPLRPDPLTGWNGSGDTNTQVRMQFPTKEAAIAY